MEGDFHWSSGGAEQQSILLLTVLYVAFAMFSLIPPQEIRSAGLTLERILSNQLGSESLDFVGYHMRRTALTRLVGMLLPFGYYVMLAVLRPDLLKVQLVYWGFLVSLGVAAAGILLSLYYWKSKWSTHPLASVLGYHGDNWRVVAGSVNVEFRRVDKFTSGPSNNRVIVTESWLVKAGIFTVHVSRLADTCLTLLQSAEVPDSQSDVFRPVQRIAIRVTSVNDAVRDFVVHVPGLEYRDFKSRLPFVQVVNVRGVTVHQTLGERFIVAFAEQVNRNTGYHLPPNTELDSCLGCMVAVPDVKITKQCAPMDDGHCRNCMCRPQWCMTCMARWFASRQDQRNPEGWLSARAPCPDCRSQFCMLDVCRVVDT